MSTRQLHYFIFGIVLQIIISYTNGKPICPGEFDGYYESQGAFDYSPTPALVPIPQPVPVRAPQLQRCQPQSVTIPNIIVALLPPTNKPVVQRPANRPPPAFPTLPQPYSLPSFSGFGGYGGEYKRFEGCGSL